MTCGLYHSHTTYTYYDLILSILLGTLKLHFCMLKLKDPFYECAESLTKVSNIKKLKSVTSMSVILKKKKTLIMYNRVLGIM